MIYDLETNSLYTSDGQIIKTLHCPLSQKWRLLNRKQGFRHRQCLSCGKEVIDTEGFDTDNELLRFMQKNPDACLKVSLCQRNITVRGEGKLLENFDKDLKLIKTAWDAESINEAVAEGFFPLVKWIHRNHRIRKKVAVFQHKETGHIITSGDYRFVPENPAYQKVLDYRFYHPLKTTCPFAAYLVPQDLKVGERVLLEEVIESVIGEIGNQGDYLPLKSCTAIFTGDDFVVEFDENDIIEVIG